MVKKPGNDEHITQSLTEMSDEEAVAVMEGRSSPTDPVEVDHAALAIARGLLSSGNEAQNDNVVTGQFERQIGRQPWGRLAAAFVVGMALTATFNFRTQIADGGEDSGVLYVSATSHYLFATRNAASGVEIPKIELAPGIVNLIVDQDYPEADELRIYLDAFTGTGRPASQGDNQWSLIHQLTSGSGGRETINVAMDAANTGEGIYRLRVEAYEDARRLGTSTRLFELTNDITGATVD